MCMCACVRLVYLCAYGGLFCCVDRGRCLLLQYDEGVASHHVLVFVERGFIIDP